MKKIIKRITGILFILLGFTPLLYFILSEIKQQVIRHKMEQRLESKLLHKVIVTENEIHWIKNGEEVLINGRMFDIKNFEHCENGTIIFTGLYDDEETLLVNEVQKHQQNENNSSSKLITQLFQLLQITFLNLPAESPHSLSAEKANYPAIEHRLRSQSITILTPPPQV